MRILHVDSGAAMQGGQWQVLYLLRGLRERGHDVKLLAAGKLAIRAREERFEVEAAGLSAMRRSSQAADLVHVHDAHAHTWAAIASKKLFIVSRRVGFPVKRNPLSLWKYGRARHFIAVSKYVSGTLTDVGLKTGTISVVYDGVPIGDFHEPARLGPVAAIVRGDSDASTVLVRAAVKAAGLEVVPMEQLRSASVFAYITEMQGLGSGALLAMAAGIPVVASRRGGLPEIVEHERTGLLVNNEIQEIAGSLTRLTRDREFAMRMARNAYDRVESEFSVDAMVRATEQVYEKVLQTR